MKSLMYFNKKTEFDQRKFCSLSLLIESIVSQLMEPSSKLKFKKSFAFSAIQPMEALCKLCSALSRKPKLDMVSEG